MSGSRYNAVGVIPARYAAVRFPGKPLALIAGKSMVQHVYERARAAKNLARLAVATDDRRIADAVAAFGGEAIMTSPDAPSGTDRIVEAVGHLDYDIIVNIQGDEPLLDAGGIDECVAALAEHPEISVATLAERITSPDQLIDANVVKVVNDFEHNALYFSRSIIPFPRGFEGPDGDPDLEKASKQLLYLKHIGLYAYRRDALMKFASMPPSPLEMIEKLEQLRILQSGGKIRIIEVEGRSASVDTPEDIAVVERILSRADAPAEAAA